MCIRDSCIKVCSMPQQPDNADIAPGIRPFGTGTDAVPAMRTNASDSLQPVSYTHLDVYKRQAQQCGFAGTARTDDGDNISLVYVQIDSA